MHWNVAPDALPGSKRLVRVLDRWLNDCIEVKIVNAGRANSKCSSPKDAAVRFHPVERHYLAYGSAVGARATLWTNEPVACKRWNFDEHKY